MRFLNNNDTGIRFVDQYGARMQKVAAAMQFTVPGIPALFAGDEIGASYQPYSVLEKLAWKDRYGLLPLYKRLIRLKHNMDALNSNDMEVLSTDLGSGLAYVRPAVGSSGPVLVLLNYGAKGRLNLKLTPPLARAAGATNGKMRDLLTGDGVQLDVNARSVGLDMTKESALVMVPAGG